MLTETTMSNEKDKKDHTIHYKVNDEQQTTTEEILTPVQIMTSAGVDPQTSHLEQLHGHEKISYKDNPNEQIEMKNGMRFITVFDGPTPVSY